MCKIRGFIVAIVFKFKRLDNYLSVQNCHLYFYVHIDVQKMYFITSPGIYSWNRRALHDGGGGEVRMAFNVGSAAMHSLAYANCVHISRGY